MAILTLQGIRTTYRPMDPTEAYRDAIAHFEKWGTSTSEQARNERPYGYEQYWVLSADTTQPTSYNLSRWKISDKYGSTPWEAEKWPDSSTTYNNYNNAFADATDTDYIYPNTYGLLLSTLTVNYPLFVIKYNGGNYIQDSDWNPPYDYYGRETPDCLGLSFDRLCLISNLGTEGTEENPYTVFELNRKYALKELNRNGLNAWVTGYVSKKENMRITLVDEPSLDENIPFNKMVFHLKNSAISSFNYNVGDRVTVYCPNIKYGNTNFITTSNTYYPYATNPDTSSSDGIVDTFKSGNNSPWHLYAYPDSCVFLGVDYAYTQGWCDLSAATITYSLNGGQEQAYTQPLYLTGNTHVDYYARWNGETKTIGKDYLFIEDLSIDIKPDSTVYSAATDVEVTISHNFDYLSEQYQLPIYYTTDGTVPTESSSLYNGSFNVRVDEDTTAVTVNAALIYNGVTYSSDQSVYQCIPPESEFDVTFNKPTFIYNGFTGTTGNLNKNSYVTVDYFVPSDYLNTAKLYVTVDGSMPTVLNNYMVITPVSNSGPLTRPFLYCYGNNTESTSPLPKYYVNLVFPLPENVANGHKLRVRLLDYNNHLRSEDSETTVYFKYTTPDVTFTPQTTSESTVQTVTVNAVNKSETLNENDAFYLNVQTENGSDQPTTGNSINIGNNNNTTYDYSDCGIRKLSVFQAGPRGLNSDSVTGVTYFNNAANMHIQPPTTTYIMAEKNVDVEIVSTSASTIYYTTDGSIPTTSSTVYTQPFTVNVRKNAPVTVNAIQTILNRDYELTLSDHAVYDCTDQAPTPTFSPEPGTYPDMVKVSLYCTDTDAVIYYTLDGTTPTTGSTVFNQPILINGTTTIKAMAYNDVYDIPTSEIATGTYIISRPARSRKAPRNSDNFNGIYVKNVTYSGDTAANYRSAYVLPSAITVTDTEADITWGYHIDNVEEDMGDYGTKCKVNDTEILIHVVFTHMGKQYTLEKTIPCVCVIDDAIDSTYTIQPEEAYAICTLENKLRVIVKARVRYTAEETTSIVTNLDNFTLSGTSTNGNFICNKSGSYFLYDDILTLNYSGSVHPANDVLLTLVENSTGYVQDKFDITVTFETGSIFEVRDDAIRMAVQTSHEEISGVTNHLTQLELNVSGITGTVSALTNSVDGISADVSQLQQTASSITSTVYNLSGEMVTHSEIQQISTAITMNVFNEIGEKTGIDISGGTITLDASKTIVTGELEINDGIAFYDQYGNPAVSIGGDELGQYADQTNGSINYRYLYVNENNTTGYSFTTEKDSLGQYNSGDTITYQYLAEWDTITPNGSTQSQWDESTAVTCQIQLYLDNNSEPFATYTATLTGATNSPMKALRANPIREFTIPSDGTVYVKYAITSQGTSQIGTRYAQVSAQVGSKQANTVNIRKGGINIGHVANYMTYLGADDTVLRKGMTGFKYGKRNDANGIPQIAVSTYSLLNSGTTFSEHPDNIMPDARVYWTPTANFTWHTSSFSACDTYYGQVQGYTSYGDRYNARIREDKLCGDLWLDMLSYEAQDLRGERIMLLLPPTTRQVVVDNKTTLHSLPEGYTVRILNMGFYNGVYIVPNLMDGYSVSEGVFYKPDGTRVDNIYFNANDTFIELVYAGTYTLSDIGMRQLWYIRNWNNL